MDDMTHKEWQEFSAELQQRITELEKIVQDQADMIVEKGKRVLELEQSMAGPGGRERRLCAVEKMEKCL